MTTPSFQELPNFNDSKYETLIEAIIQGTCIFVGAGISKIAGYRLWDELRSDMVDYFWANRAKLHESSRDKIDISACAKLKEINHVLDALDYLYIINKELFNDGIKSIFNEGEKVIKDDIYIALKKISMIGENKNIFVTTNLDKGLQNTLSVHDSNASIFPYLDNPPKYINYVHGRIDIEESWILTSSQYHRGYIIDDAPCVQFLKYIFETYNVLFIGYGLGDPDLMNVLALTSKRKKHFWIEGWCRKSQDELLFRSTKFKELFNIHWVPYCIENEGNDVIFRVIDLLEKAALSKIN